MLFVSATLFLTVAILAPSKSLLFRPDQFKDMTDECKKSQGKPVRFILNEDRPAMYASLDPAHLPLMALQRMERVKLINRITMDDKGNLMLTDPITGEVTSGYLSVVDTLKFAANKVKDPNFSQMQEHPHDNTTFDCVLHFETHLPTGDKQPEKYDALSLIIIELDQSPRKFGFEITKPGVELVTFGHDGYSRRKVTKRAQYSDRVWPQGHNPNFLLSGQLSGFDSVDYRTKIDPQHIVKPETLHSTFDKPASITLNLTNWTSHSHIYFAVTSYKYLKRGERCHEHKEFDCTSPNFLSASTDHMCMSVSLACDGLPNCGQDFLPNLDENCFKIHWSSVLLSLVSYILLAITLLLCLSCFARVLIQWSVRSSLAELRGINSPTGSFRSSARFFSFLGTTFTGRWDRPPPTYDEAMKHVNPDLAPPRPQDPPPYSESGDRDTQNSSSAHVTVDTPPPEYRSTEGLNRIETAAACNETRRHHHHRHHHRRHNWRQNRTTTQPPPPQQPKSSDTPSENADDFEVIPNPHGSGPGPRNYLEYQICAYNLCSH